MLHAAPKFNIIWGFPSQNRGPQYNTLNSRILIIRAPKEGAPHFRKLPYPKFNITHRPLSSSFLGDYLIGFYISTIEKELLRGAYGCIFIASGRLGGEEHARHRSQESTQQGPNPPWSFLETQGCPAGLVGGG